MNKLRINLLNLPNNFDFFYLASCNLFIIFFHRIFVLKLPPFYFFKEIFLKNVSFIFLRGYFFKVFLKTFLFYYNDYFAYFILKIRLKGLGFRIRRFSKFLIRFYFTSVNYFYLHLPLNVILKIRKRKLFFLSFSKWVIQVLILNIFLLKKIGPYFFRGFRYPRNFIIFRHGKKKL